MDKKLNDKINLVMDLKKRIDQSVKRIDYLSQDYSIFSVQRGIMFQLCSLQGGYPNRIIDLEGDLKKNVLKLVTDKIMSDLELEKNNLKENEEILSKMLGD